jgi:hypothetical protein
VASASVIDAFLAICVHIISTVKQGVSNRAIKILFSYLKNGNLSLLLYSNRPESIQSFQSDQIDRKKDETC